MLTTSTMLLESLQDGENQVVWTDFCKGYRPLLLAFAHRLGLNQQEAHDAVQETFLACWKALREGRYNRSRGRLRAWLAGIAANKVSDIHRRRPRELPVGNNGSSTGLIANVPDERTMSEVWNAEEARAIVQKSLELVRKELEPTTVEAFELVAIQEWPAERVAAQLDISRNAVYQAKSRVLARMRELHEYLIENW